MLRESTEDLKAQLHHERTEERRKLVAGKRWVVVVDVLVMVNGSWSKLTLNFFLFIFF